MSETVVIFGPRLNSWDNPWRGTLAVCAEVRRLPRNTTVLSGGATGVDTWAVEWAQRMGRGVRIEPADWDTEGRRAGPKRNARMAYDADRGIWIRPTGLITPGSKSMAGFLDSMVKPYRVVEVA